MIEPGSRHHHIVVRAGAPHEAPALREIAIAAKAHWGYGMEQVRQWAEGDFSIEALQTRQLYVAESDGTLAGWASTIPHGEVCWLEDLWIEPAWMGHGVGGLLFRHAAERAHQQGAKVLEWEAEPNAVGFYEKMGGRYLRPSKTTEWGRRLPVMGISLERAET
jgi:GNAT superfamily N-acetyltransferase